MFLSLMVAATSSSSLDAGDRPFVASVPSRELRFVVEVVPFVTPFVVPLFWLWKIELLLLLLLVEEEVVIARLFLWDFNSAAALFSNDFCSC